MDHPRSRGVYNVSVWIDGGTWGSSPLARGLPRTCASWSLCRGIIPARAGFTPINVGGCGASWDHPRSRGVYLAASLRCFACVGSSPLARGLQSPKFTRTNISGIIPARAGFTSRRVGNTSQRADHPRSRGVYISSGRPSHLNLGSSPLARGLRIQDTETVSPSRIIPARAGFTDKTPGEEGAAEDHPRSRGVYSSPV